MNSYSILNLFPITDKVTLFIFYILCRVLGLFLVSPFLSNKSITATARFYLSLFIALILGVVLYPDYLGSHPKYVFHHLPNERGHAFFVLGIEIIKELSIGYLLGFMFNIVFEAMLLAGEMIDSMIGLATAQFFDPFSNTFQSMLGILLLMFGALFMLIIDFHHVFIRLLAQSFSIVPLGDFHLREGLENTITFGTSLLFIYVVKIGAIPIVILACGLVGIAFTVRVLPEMNLLLTGLPMRVLIGLYVMMLALAYIPPVFNQALMEFAALANQILENLGP
jgi:flagellar biosynthesis protein FliR